MECVETHSDDGLSRLFRVVIPARDLQARLDAKIAEVGPQVQLKGFRPGKVPPAHIRKVYGPSMMQEVITEEVQKSTQEALANADFRPASEPHLHLESDMDQVVAGQADLAFHFHVDIMPDFEPADPATLNLERLVTPVSDQDVEDALKKLVDANQDYVPKDGPAVEGDALTIDFVGKMDGVAFEGGSGKDAQVLLGNKNFIPGFEEQLIGVKTGEERTLNVSFPADYGADNLAGKPATFDVKVTLVREAKDAAMDDTFAQKVGMETLDDVRAALRTRLENEHNTQSRLRVKRALFDQLDAAHTFDLPKTMVENEFAGIWRQVQEDKRAGGLDEEDAQKSEADLAADYRRIAERRVRLGLVLAEIGRRNAIEVPEDEVAAAIGRQARAYPGQERQIVEYYQQNPQALAQIRAPLYEDRVVDFILELAKTDTKTVSRDELFAEDPTSGI
ncbi:MAG: trigger factor [Hyphomonadaceae bacterium]